MIGESTQEALQRAHEQGYQEGFEAGWHQARAFPNTELAQWQLHAAAQEESNG